MPREDSSSERQMSAAAAANGREAQRGVAPSNMPEDPPEYGEDGLHVLNDSNEYLVDAVVVGDDAGSGSGSSPKKQKDKKKIKKVSSSASSEEEEGVGRSKGSIAGVDDFKRPNEKDIATQIMEADERERAERVWRRRHPTNPFLRAYQVIIPYGGIVSSAFSIASSTIGGGIIGLPAAYQMSGIGMATIYLVVVVAMAIYSFVLLATVSHKTGLYNWELIARRLMGRGWDYMVVFVMWVLCFGGDVSYIIALKSILAGFLTNSPTATDYIKSNAGQRLVTSMLWIGVILPMCVWKEINSLRIVSTVAILFVVFFTITCIIHSGQTLHSRGMRTDLEYFTKGNQAINGLSNLMFAFIAQVNSPEVAIFDFATLSCSYLLLPAAFTCCYTKYTCYTLPATCYLLLNTPATCYQIHLQTATCYLLHATAACFMLHAAARCTMQPATHFMLHASCYMLQPATRCCMLHAARHLLRDARSHHCFRFHLPPSSALSCSHALSWYISLPFTGKKTPIFLYTGSNHQIGTFFLESPNPKKHPDHPHPHSFRGPSFSLFLLFCHCCVSCVCCCFKPRFIFCCC